MALRLYQLGYPRTKERGEGLEPSPDQRTVKMSMSFSLCPSPPSAGSLVGHVIQHVAENLVPDIAVVSDLSHICVLPGLLDGVLQLANASE